MFLTAVSSFAGIESCDCRQTHRCVRWDIILSCLSICTSIFREKNKYNTREGFFCLRKIAFAESMDAQRIKFLKSNFTTKQLVKNILKNKN